jgi:[acyl-carrier-protein] S-malonyltransferase
MGARLLADHPEAREWFERADQALGFGLTRLCLEGPDEELRLTEHAQPALLTVGFATARVLEATGVRADMAAGHSLGEITALTLAEALPFEDAVRLVRLRGRLMQEAVPAGEGAMAALRTGDAEELKAIVAGVGTELGLVVPANFNGPDQTVLSGHAAAVRRALVVAKGLGVVGREIPVSAPFHCELMRPAAERFSDALGEQSFAETLRFPVVTNVTAEPVTSGAAAREFLALQVTHPVRWGDCLLRMVASGIRQLVEVGPGDVLTKLSRRIVRDVTVRCADGADGTDGVARLVRDLETAA